LEKWTVCTDENSPTLKLRGMYTAAECREKAKLKMDISKLAIENRRKHVHAAEAWLYRAAKLEDPLRVLWKEQGR
jgi:hypothetical protein